MGLTENSVIDVAIGMSFLFFILAIFATALTEAGTSLTKYRSKAMASWLKDNLTESGPTADHAAEASKAEALLAAFYSHPAVNGLTRTGERPSYVPSEHAITALLDMGATTEADAARGWTIAAHTAAHTKAFIDNLPDCPLRDGLLSAWTRSGGDVEKFRTSAERWFDDGMDRLSGWYKRRIQLMLWIFGLVIALVLNADAIHIAETLYKDPSIRQLVDTQAQQVTTAHPSVDNATHYLRDLPLPLGWGGPTSPFPPTIWSWNFPLQLFGIVLTASAVALGAPFWFDTLSKLGSMRSTGPVPAPTNSSTTR
jgi:hypothetical protein